MYQLHWEKEETSTVLELFPWLMLVIKNLKTLTLRNFLRALLWEQIEYTPTLRIKKTEEKSYSAETRYDLSEESSGARRKPASFLDSLTTTSSLSASLSSSLSSRLTRSAFVYAHLYNNVTYIPRPRLFLLFRAAARGVRPQPPLPSPPYFRSFFIRLASPGQGFASFRLYYFFLKCWRKIERVIWFDLFIDLRTQGPT